jgi:rhamnulokinase
VAPRRVAAVDLGAQSGRVAVARFDGERIDLEVVHRFPNRPLWLPDGLHWNIEQLFAEVLTGLSEAAVDSPLDGVGIDTWGCDYGLLDRHGRLLGLPFHYRDEARSAQSVLERALRRVSQHDLYAASGIQVMAINTVFQLLAEPDTIDRVSRIALIPDLLNFWLTGTLANELTVASTTGLLQSSGSHWAATLIDALGLPTAPFGSEVVSPGLDLGQVLSEHRYAGNAVGTPVRTVGAHDTASAFAAAPHAGPQHAVLSSGTWSLLGIHTAEPQLGALAEKYNLTNERAVDGSTRLLRNVMGMWLIEECRREWGGADYDRLYAEAAAVDSQVPLFDPDDGSLLAPGPMVARITALITAGGQAAPIGRPQLIRSILLSLACKYRLVAQRLEQVSGRRIELIQVVGGGAKNRLLCQLTADVTRRLVSAGPTEATLLGNALCQLIATGDVANDAETRQLSERSIELQHFTPNDHVDGDAIFGRFLEVTGCDQRPADERQLPHEPAIRRSHP